MKRYPHSLGASIFVGMNYFVVWCALAGASGDCGVGNAGNVLG